LKIKSYSLLFVVLLTTTLAACNQSPDLQANAAAGKTDRAERPAHAVETIVVSRQAIAIKRTLTGTLEAPRTVHIHTEQSGRIIELPYYEGDKVNKDATLVRLDDSLLRANLAKATASRKQSELDLKRLKRLVPSKLASEDELARASTSVELANAEESLQRTLLSRTIIKAPYNSVVSERLKEPSDIVAVNDHILTLFDPKLMTAAIQVPEQLHGRVAIGDSVKMRIDSLGDSSFAAKILRIHPVVDPNTRQGTIEVRVDPVPAGARPGQLCRVTLETAETPRRLIPLNALQFDAKGSYVYRVSDDSKALRTPVTIGLQIGESIEIIDGVQDGDKIISKGFLGLKSGKTVRIIKPAQKQSANMTAYPLSQG
jgi:RND family efflux transporter MFP subunit